MTNKKALILMILSFFVNQNIHSDSLIKKIKSKASSVVNMAKATAKSTVTEVKTAVAKDQKSIQVVVKDVKQGKIKQAAKDSGKVVVNSLNVVKAVPLVGSVVESGETAVSSGIKVEKDIKQISKDSKTMGLKKALKKDGKNLAKDSWSTVSNAASAVGTPLLLASGVGIGEGMAVKILSQSGFIAKGLEATVNDTKTLISNYKKDAADPTVSRKNRELDFLKNGLNVIGDVAGIGAMGSMGMGKSANTLFMTQFGAQDISANIGNAQMLSSDKKLLKQDQAQLAQMKASGASQQDIDAYTKYISQDKDYIAQDKSQFIGTTLKVIGDTRQENIGLQSAFLMGGGAVNNIAATQQAERDLKNAKKNGASQAEIAQAQAKANATKEMMAGDTIGSLFHHNMAITMGAQEIGQKIDQDASNKLNAIQTAQQQAASGS